MLTPAAIIPHPPAPDHAIAAPGIRWAWRELRPGHAEAIVRAWLHETLLDANGTEPTRMVSLHRDQHGRPRLDPPSCGLDISWSHSGEGLLIALGRGVQLGIDLERLRPRPRALQLAQRFFTAAEADWLASHDDSERMPAFIRLWCAKEAVLKAHGRGLAFGLHKLEFGEHDGRLFLIACDCALGRPDEWQLREWTPQTGYHAALAWRASTSHSEPVPIAPGLPTMTRP